MKQSKINFDQVANALGFSENQAIVSLCVPPVNEATLHLRAFCFAELLMEVCDRPVSHSDSWVEVKRIISHSEKDTIVLLQFNALPQYFPLVLGNKQFSNVKYLLREIATEDKKYSKLVYK